MDTSNQSDLNNTNDSIQQTFYYDGGGGSMGSSRNDRKKIQRDPFAHRRVEKTRRDRMNLSLNKLSSLIPESFRRQVTITNPLTYFKK